MRALAAGWLFLPIAVACGDSSDAPVGECEAGDTRSCELAGGCAAERRCEGDPPEWSRCRCRDAPQPDAGSQEPPSEGPRLGAACERDGECPDAALCLKPDTEDYFGGGPAAGVCVADCSDDASVCETFDAAVCVDVSPRASDDEDAGASMPSALCFERCTLGDEAPDKCHAVPGVACEALDEERPTEGFCRPLCASDADCGDDRSCDLQSGACVDAAPIDYQSFGGACEPDAGAGDCDGLCVSLTDAYAVCGQRCAFGQPADCAPLPSTAPRGGCLYTAPEGTLGDVGYCAELCDCNIDCSHPEAVCDAFTDTELLRVFGRMGVCTAPELAIGEGLECG